MVTSFLVGAMRSGREYYGTLEGSMTAAREGMT